jgi:hypothetical protein
LPYGDLVSIAEEMPPTPRRRDRVSQRNRLLLDVAMLAGLLVITNPALTGLQLHEWLGVALIVPALAHLVINWDWVIRVATNVIDKLLSTSRVNFGVDLVLFVTTVAAMLSGFMVSQFVVSLGGASLPLWHTVHSVASDLMLASLLVHFALHWRWMANAVGRLLSPPRPRPQPVRVTSTVPPAHQPVGRR